MGTDGTKEHSLESGIQLYVCDGLQHITFKMPDAIDYTEPLCKIVAGEKDVKLWNLDWLKDEYKKKFPQEEICTDEARAKIKSVISIDEVALFNAYK